LLVYWSKCPPSQDIIAEIAATASEDKTVRAFLESHMEESQK